MAVHPQPVVDQMIALAARVWSGSRIAEEIGGGVSRCAVIAALWRRGIRPIRTIVRKPRKLKPKATEAIAQTAAAAGLPIVPECAPANLYELPGNGCHFPIGGEGRSTMFCAAARAGHPSDRPFHRKLAAAGVQRRLAPAKPLVFRSVRRWR